MMQSSQGFHLMNGSWGNREEALEPLPAQRGKSNWELTKS